MSATPTVRRLEPADVPALGTFLLEHADASLFLRANLHAAGVVDRGEPLQATYVGAWEGERVRAVAAHCWNGNLLLQAPEYLDAVVRDAVARSGRRVAGLLGPWSQVVAARTALGLDGAPTTMASRDGLFALGLSDLAAPPARAGVRCRPTRDADLPVAAAWRVAYCVELLGARNGPELWGEAVTDLARLHAGGSTWLLEDDGVPVAFSAFNARLPEVVQVGGVYTPPRLRSRGYGRAVVAGSLAAVRPAGVTRAVLFTGDDNAPARRAYAAIGFRQVGDYGLVLFAGAQAATR